MHKQPIDAIVWNEGPLGVPVKQESQGCGYPSLQCNETGYKIALYVVCIYQSPDMLLIIFEGVIQAVKFVG